MRVFGKASDFYRLRVLKVNEDSELDLDWRDDILFKSPQNQPMTTHIWYVVQAVSVDTEAPYNLRRFATGEAAMRFKDKVEDVLREQTKQQFEERFPAFSGDVPGNL